MHPAALKISMHNNFAPICHQSSTMSCGIINPTKAAPVFSSQRTKEFLSPSKAERKSQWTRTWPVSMFSSCEHESGGIRRHDVSTKHSQYQMHPIFPCLKDSLAKNTVSAVAPPKIVSLSDSCLTVDGQGFIVEPSGVKNQKIIGTH